MRIWWMALLSVGVLCGCYGSGIPKNYQPRFSQYVGTLEYELVNVFGVPSSVYDIGDDKYLVYDGVFQDTSSGKMNGFKCNTIFLSRRGLIKASFYDKSTCIMKKN